MKPTLEWKNGKCTNPPPGWVACVWWRRDDTCWWGAELAEGDRVRSSHTGDNGYLTIEPTQRACEVALWRLGVLPLPEWNGPVILLGDFRACVAKDDTGWWFRIRRSSDAPSNDGLRFATEADAKRQTEVILRALIAAALEAEK